MSCLWSALNAFICWKAGTRSAYRTPWETVVRSATRTDQDKCVENSDRTLVNQDGELDDGNMAKLG